LVDDDVIASFFRPGEFRLKTFDNRQVFDFESLKGRLLSSSYTPQAGHPNYEPVLAELRAIFEAHQVDGLVPLEYDTKLYYGRLPAAG
jgi:hypothetical protein